MMVQRALVRQYYYAVEHGEIARICLILEILQLATCQLDLVNVYGVAIRRPR